MTSEQYFEIGKLYLERGDLKIAEEKLLIASKGFLDEKNFPMYLKAQNILLRIYVEREDSSKFTEVKEHLQDLVLKEGLELTAKTYYTLGVCASYKNQLDLALEYLQKSLVLAMKDDVKEDICHAINGIAIVYYQKNDLDRSLKEVQNLKIFFEVIKNPSLEISSQLLNAHILRKQKKYEEALNIFWDSYEILKKHKDLMIQISLLFGLGITYHELGNTDVARVYLELAQKLVDPDNMKHHAKNISKKLKELGVQPRREFDLILNSANNTVTEIDKGMVDFKNQFILLDLLHLFMRSPGEIYSKEALVDRIWKQHYNPSIHDNKIYVTIKRLRKLIEPDYSKPRYIFRAKDGYFLNKKTRVLMEH